MKKTLIIISILFMAAASVRAQEAQNKESKPENTVKSEEVKEAQPSKENAVTTQEVIKQEPAQVKPVTNDKKAETPKDQTKAGKDQYLADLSGKDEIKIITAAEWLAEKEEKSAVPQLVSLLKNDNRVKVRAYASIALGVIADESCIPALNEALLNDSSADVRYAALLAIHRINPAKSVDALKKAKETESDPYIKDYIEKMEAKWKEKK